MISTGRRTKVDEIANDVGHINSILNSNENHVVQTASIYRFNSYAQFYRLTRLPFRSTFDYSAVLMVRKETKSAAILHIFPKVVVEGQSVRNATNSSWKIANEKGQFLTSNAVVTVTRRILAVSTTHGPAAADYHDT
ncbi:hypothetical protein OUZ56_030686 [Daphnia magna]|uniref:Uncharacterized protein n=1 Tax=Daphnia magna TaxID=35525 RepID=A0ABQ9ZS15_9CRUS|nr:hypothetical protein OUZ56_030686 [Daphnia magna]